MGMLFLLDWRHFGWCPLFIVDARTLTNSWIPLRKLRRWEDIVRCFLYRKLLSCLDLSIHTIIGYVLKSIRYMLYCLESSYFALALTHHALMLYFISTLRIRSLDIASCSYADANILSSLFMFNIRGALVVELNSNVGVYQQCVYPFGNPFAQLSLPRNPLRSTPPWLLRAIQNIVSRWTDQSSSSFLHVRCSNLKRLTQAKKSLEPLYKLQSSKPSMYDKLFYMSDLVADSTFVFRKDAVKELTEYFVAQFDITVSCDCWRSLLCVTDPTRLDIESCWKRSLRAYIDLSARENTHRRGWICPHWKYVPVSNIPYIPY